MTWWRPSDMRFYQDLGTPRPAQASCMRGCCGPSYLGQPQPHAHYSYNPGPYFHGPSTYYQWPGTSGQPTGSYGQGAGSYSQPGLYSDQGYYSQGARPQGPQLVPSDHQGWPIRHEEDWCEAVVYCPRKAPCFQKGTPHCQALVGGTGPMGPSWPEASRSDTPLRHSGAPQSDRALSTSHYNPECSGNTSL